MMDLLSLAKLIGVSMGFVFLFIMIVRLQRAQRYEQNVRASTSTQLINEVMSLKTRVEKLENQVGQLRNDLEFQASLREDLEKRFNTVF